MAKIKGGRKRTFSSLESRRAQFDASKKSDGTKRPGSNKK